jgi:Arc/MetJ-type ribon-helix-helix transcriptional regulator
MRDEAIATAVEQFVKNVSFSAQREIERVIRSAVANGRLRNRDETLTAAVTVINEKIGLNTTIYSKIEF